MTSREAQLASPKLLSGLSARAWRRILIGGWVAGGVLVAVAVALNVFVPDRLIIPTFVIPLIFVGFILAFVSQLALRYGIPQEKAELRAGYTTLGSRHPEVEQIDPSTGLVVRAAGEAYLPRGRGARMSPELPPTDVPRPGLARRILPWTVGSIALSIVNVAGLEFIVNEGTSGVLAPLYLMSGVYVLFAAAILVGSLRMRRTLTRLQEAAPTEFAFVFRTSPGIVSALQALVPVTDVAPKELVRARQITASRTGLTFWYGASPKRVGSLPWSKVIAVQPDRVPFGRSTGPAVTITFRDDDADEIVALPLMNAEANYITVASTAEIRWIASELNQLRTAVNSARLV